MKIALTLTLILFSFVFLFENCSPQIQSQLTTAGSSADDSDLSDSKIYFGGDDGIEQLNLNYKTGEITYLGLISFPGLQVGWISDDVTTDTVYAADSGNANTLALYNYNSNTSLLEFNKSFGNYTNQIVQLNLYNDGSRLNLFGSSYSNSKLTYHQLDLALTTLTNTQTVSYAVNSKTHSSSFDQTRQILYVANLGRHKIYTYTFNNQTLTYNGEIAVSSPRTVVYDETYDKVFVVTESYTVSSTIKVFSVTGVSSTVTYNEIGSLDMPLIGGDLKINHQHGFAMATARETGKESVWGLPLTSTGAVDSSRSSFSVSVSQKLPRTLLLSKDGNYMILGMASIDQENVVGYKLNFDTSNNFLSAQKIFQEKIGTSAFMCGLIFN